MFIYWKFGPSVVVVVLDGQGLVGALKVTGDMPLESLRDILLGPSVFLLQHGDRDMAQRLRSLVLTEGLNLDSSTQNQMSPNPL